MYVCVSGQYRKRTHGQESREREREKVRTGFLFKVSRFSVGECLAICVSKRELHHVESSRDLAVSIMTIGLSVGSHFLQKSQIDSFCFIFFLSFLLPFFVLMT